MDHSKISYESRVYESVDAMIGAYFKLYVEN